MALASGWTTALTATITPAPTAPCISKPLPTKGADGGRRPKRGSRGESAHVESLAQNNAAGKKADTGDDLRGHAPRVRYLSAEPGNSAKQGRADGNERHRVQTGRSLPPLPLESDRQTEGGSDC